MEICWNTTFTALPPDAAPLEVNGEYPAFDAFYAQVASHSKDVDATCPPLARLVNYHIPELPEEMPQSGLAAP